MRIRRAVYMAGIGEETNAYRDLVRTDRQCAYKCNIQAPSLNHCCHAKQQVLHILGVCL